MVGDARGLSGTEPSTMGQYLSAVLTDLIGGRTEKCELTKEDKDSFPHCQQKLEVINIVRTWKASE